MSDMPDLVTDAARVAAIARAAAAAGELYFDLEFVSEGRYIPELALVQVGWREGDVVEIDAIDCLAVDPGPIFELLASDRVVCVAHAARQDLGLLAARFDLRARAFHDTQIAAAFVGIGDQVGYGRLVEHLLGHRLDKGAQFTDWLARPLSDRQLAYALDDVRYLPQVWARLKKQLEAADRTAWVQEESERLAADSAAISTPQEAWRGVKGAGRLERRGLGALQALAAWREREARSSNKPPSWILPDKALVDVCRTGARSERDLKSVRGIGEGTVRRYGRAILEQIAAGQAAGATDAPGERAELDGDSQLLAQIVSAFIQARCAAEKLAARFVGTRADAEELVLWFRAGASDAEAPPLVRGWRRDLVGDDCLRWLRGEAGLVTGEPLLGLREL
jgi:ribonuclease D